MTHVGAGCNGGGGGGDAGSGGDGGDGGGSEGGVGLGWLNSGCDDGNALFVMS